MDNNGQNHGRQLRDVQHLPLSAPQHLNLIFSTVDFASRLSSPHRIPERSPSASRAPAGSAAPTVCHSSRCAGHFAFTSDTALRSRVSWEQPLTAILQLHYELFCGNCFSLTPLDDDGRGTGRKNPFPPLTNAPYAAWSA